jgi:hypothetical protein
MIGSDFLGLGVSDRHIWNQSQPAVCYIFPRLHALSIVYYEVDILQLTINLR